MNNPSKKNIQQPLNNPSAINLNAISKENQISKESNTYSSTTYEYVTKNGFSILREFQGHGIGREMHEDPGIPNYGKPGRGLRLEPGMTICIEPMVIAGSREIMELDDGWTIVSRDGSNGAHYENTILITENDPEILTKL